RRPHSATSALASSIDPVRRSRFGVSVWRTALRMGYFSRRQDAADGLNRWRGTPSHSEAEAWRARSTRRTRRFGEARATARFTAAVVLPTPPLLLRTAMITGNLSGILSTNQDG